MFEVVLPETGVLDPAEHYGFEDVLLVVELVVTKPDLFERFGYGSALEHLDYTLVAEHVASQVDVFEC